MKYEKACSEDNAYRQSVFGLERHLFDRGVFVHFVQFLLETTEHLVPHVHEAMFNHLKLFSASLQQRLPLALVLRSHALQFTLVAFDQLLRTFKKFVPAFLIELFALYCHSQFYLFLEVFSVFVEASLAKVLCPLLHFNYASGVVQPATLDRPLLYRYPEVVQFSLLLLLELILD